MPEWAVPGTHRGHLRLGREKNKAPEEIARELEAAKEDPNIADTIWRTVRGLMEAPNDAAAVPLGVLAAEYIRDKHPTDAFFRGVVRLLEELEAAELDELRRLLGWVIATTKRAEVELIARAGTVDTALDEYVNDVGLDSEPEKRARTTVVSDPERLFALLTGSRLAVSLPGMRFGRGLPEVAVRRNIVERLLRILGTT